MTQIPAGWYPDPDPEAPEPRGTRYWDGQNWTEHVQQPPGQAPAAPPASYPAGQPGGEVTGAPTGHPADQPAAAPPYAPMSPYGGAPGPGGPTTPDGQAISGWGPRAAALVIDWVIWLAVTGIVGFSWVRDMASEYSDFVSRMLESESAPTFADQMNFADSIASSVLALTLVGIAVSFLYNVGLLKWRAATFGQMALGIKVRLREQPGPLSWGTVLLRWVGKQGYRLLSLVPLLGLLGFLYKVLNYLWPLWDDKNQALHDKVAKTNVVRSRG